MAAAEARAAWQRTANRYFVQEDAKRAPKLACCQSSSSSSKQFDSGPANPADVPDHPATDSMPLNKKSFSSLPTDTRWWNQMQPNYGYQNGMTYEQLKALEIEIGTSNPTSENPAFNEAQLQKSDSVYTNDHNGTNHNGSGYSLNACTKNAKEVEKREVKPLYGLLPREFVEVVDVKENYELMDMDAFDGKPVSKHSSEFEIDLDSPWIKIEKALPWWRTTDIDEIASLVSQRTYECIENCDLPPSQKLCFRKHPADARQHMMRRSLSKFDLSYQTGSILNGTVCGQECPDSIVTQRKQKVFEENFGRCSASEKSFSYNKDIPETGKFSEGDTSKAELMEALRHSQTRAREAEKAVKQANAEKEHIIQLFFKQASQLFACRQWLQLLQLDQPFYIQMKDYEQPFSSRFPLTLPWMSYKGRKQRKNAQRASRKRRAKHSRPRHDLGKYAAAFALGLSLIGAGLLLGWTVGWMLPPF